MASIALHLVLASVQGAKEPWAVFTDEPPTLQTLWQYARLFQIEELFLDSKPGAFELEDSLLRSTDAMEALISIWSLPLPFSRGTTQGMAVQIAGLRSSG